MIWVAREYILPAGRASPCKPAVGRPADRRESHSGALPAAFFSTLLVRFGRFEGRVLSARFPAAGRGVRAGDLD